MFLPIAQLTVSDRLTVSDCPNTLALLMYVSVISVISVSAISQYYQYVDVCTSGYHTDPLNT